MDTYTDLDQERILQTAKWIKNTNKPMAVHAEDKRMIVERTAFYKSTGQNNSSYVPQETIRLKPKLLNCLLMLHKKLDAKFTLYT